MRLNNMESLNKALLTAILMRFIAVGALECTYRLSDGHVLKRLEEIRCAPLMNRMSEY